MPIRIELENTESHLFCCSKWWGNPDMPEEMPYPSVRTAVDGEEIEYPLTFICQIDCEDLAPFDKDNRLPHEGMLYFFAAIDGFIGFDSPVTLKKGLLEKGYVVVKYAKKINYETFRSHILLDEDDQPMVYAPKKMVFSEDNDENCTLRMLVPGNYNEYLPEFPSGKGDLLCLMEIKEEPQAYISMPENMSLKFIIRESDLEFCNFKKTAGCYTE